VKYHLIDTESGNLYVWQYPDFDKLIATGKKKKEVERQIIKELFEHLKIDYQLLNYTSEGAPFLKNHDSQYLSISHSNGWFAVYFDKVPVGVDIQVFTTSLYKGSSYFLSKEEQKWADQELCLQLIWCAKEALYKKYGGKISDLKNDVITKVLDIEIGNITMNYNGNLEQLRFSLLPNCTLTYTYGCH
jgi:phosphopantetheinyl transferase